MTYSINIDIGRKWMSCYIHERCARDGKDSPTGGPGDAAAQREGAPGGCKLRPGGPASPARLPLQRRGRPRSHFAVAHLVPLAQLRGGGPEEGRRVAEASHPRLPADAPAQAVREPR